MPQSRLDTPLQHSKLDALRRCGCISPDRYWDGIRALNPGKFWAGLAARLFLLIGVALVLAAIIFFFAFNWADLSRWQKLGMLQACVVLALGTGQWFGFSKLQGKLMLMAAAILIGVCLAVFGQVYQTGADAFGFFGLWFLLVLPWAIASRFAPIWVLAFVLANLTLWFFWNQVGQFHSQFHYVTITTAMALLNGCGLLLCHRLGPGTDWLRGSWLRPLFLLGNSVPLTIPFYDWIIRGEATDSMLLLGTACWAIVHLGLFAYYRWHHFDPGALAYLGANGSLALVIAATRLFDKLDLFDSGLGFFLLAAITIGLSGVVVYDIRGLLAQHAAVEPPPREEKHP